MAEIDEIILKSGDVVGVGDLVEVAGRVWSIDRIQRRTPEERKEFAAKARWSSAYQDVVESGRDFDEWVKEMTKDRVFLSMTDEVQEIRMGQTETVFLPRSAQEGLDTFIADAVKVRGHIRRRIQPPSCNPRHVGRRPVRVRSHRRRR